MTADDPEPFELTKMLIQAGARIKKGPHHPNSLGVQFVQIGSDPAAATSLPKLIVADTGVCLLFLVLLPWPAYHLHS